MCRRCGWKAGFRIYVLTAAKDDTIQLVLVIQFMLDEQPITKPAKTALSYHFYQTISDKCNGFLVAYLICACLFIICRPFQIWKCQKLKHAQLLSYELILDSYWVLLYMSTRALVGVFVWSYSFSVWWVLESCQSVVSLHDTEGCRPPALSTTLLCLNLITARRPCHYSPEQPSDGRPVGSGGRIPNNSMQSHTLLGTAYTHWDGHRLIQTTQTQTEIQMQARPLSRTPH